MSHGADAAAGIPVESAEKSGSPARSRSTISVVVESGSRPTLISAFQPAWQSAANSTARKTAFSNGYALAAAGAHNFGPGALRIARAARRRRRAPWPRASPSADRRGMRAPAKPDRPRPAPTISSACCPREDHADGARRHAGLFLDARGDRHVVAGRGRRAGVGGDAARRHADEIEALGLQSLGDGDRIVGRQPIGPPVAAGDAGAERHFLRHHRAHRARNRQRISACGSRTSRRIGRCACWTPAT